MGLRRNWLTGDWEEFESINGVKVTHAVTDADGNVTIVDGPAPRPDFSGSYQLESRLAMAVPIEQMEKFNADARRHGTRTEYIPDPKMPSYAKAVFTDRAARKAEMRRRNMFDREGGYGDADPIHHGDNPLDYITGG
jgi:hypothetical protein